MNYFYIRDFTGADDSDFNYCLDYVYNEVCINPIYQLYIMITHSSFFDGFFYDVIDLDFFEIEAMLSECFSNHHDEFKGDRLKYNTSKEGFLYGDTWQTLRKNCSIFLKRYQLAPWKIL